ncbi:hypothetical protein [Pseudonocardia abyssalis]|uniref:Uncharacterized protein n=1 Tax=Pseudonocardia abyssalis TaxID=2792008 RepID=A0ABS6UTD7_9PSEU|nr:hypothetical protein [Pseudonocardia abyssalis]MBW0117911.1 hypothetical protein [Pseudonocardia abyssalis]MBW0135492.1 hypothetical protein [Pseudonocardia abyssalis]
MPAVHRESHDELLRNFDLGPARQVDAIIVAAGRTTEHLRPAAQLATELGCVLLTMFSPGRADPGEFRTLAADTWPELRWEHLTVPDDLSHPLLPASASPAADARDWRHGSLSTKRNLALLIARMVGWDTVFLVDDDIVALDAGLVRDAARRLGPSAAIGLCVRDYPDNSVVCHANRLSGRPQDVFVGAAALVVDVTQRFGFFPNVYNEDWLFLYDAVADGRVGRLDGASQIDYDPFEDGARASAEEFGEIIAEGLMSALHGPPGQRPPLDEAYWAQFLTARREFITAAEQRLSRMPGWDAQQAVRSLRVARSRARTITPRACTQYVRSWRADLLVWEETLAALTPVDDFEAAARQLGLSGTLAGLTA